MLKSAKYRPNLLRFIIDFSPGEDRKPLVSYQASPKPERVSEAVFCARGGFFCNFLQIFLEFNLGKDRIIKNRPYLVT